MCFGLCCVLLCLQVADLTKMIRLPPGVLLYKEDTPGFDSFIIASGQVKLTKANRLIGLRGRGEINGATCLIAAGDLRAATVTTTRETLVMNITYDEFDTVLQREPELRNGMMWVLMLRLQDSYTRLTAVQRLKARISYFQDFRKELRLDVRNIRLAVSDDPTQFGQWV
jgi:CRP-like cAMP-binding protein